VNGSDFFEAWIVVHSEISKAQPGLPALGWHIREKAAAWDGGRYNGKGMTLGAAIEG
jgi:hypothetical protein